MTLADGVRKLEEEGLAGSGAGGLGFSLRLGVNVGVAHHSGVFVGAAADFEEVEACGDEEGDLGHGFFEGSRAVVGRVEFDADCEGGGYGFAGFG